MRTPPRSSGSGSAGPPEHRPGPRSNLAEGERFWTGQRVRRTDVTVGVPQDQCGDVGDVGTRHRGDSAVSRWAADHSRLVGEGGQQVGIRLRRCRITLDHAFDKPGIPQVVADEPAADAIETHAVTLGGNAVRLALALPSEGVDCSTRSIRHLFDPALRG